MNLMGIAQFAMKRPTDKTIRIGRIVFGLILILALYYNLIILNKGVETTYFGQDLANFEMTIKYILIALGIVPVFMGASNICLAKKKYVKIIQIVFGILLMFVAGKVLKASPNIDIDFLIGFMSLFPLIAGITGKCITSNCMKYKEKITKIRV
ncbi:MAG: hypothetical protein PHG82_05545 [Candidatus Gracilibacteria bacterium]|nr:hypothetical protein [Candidatus Gracilibacteria bacterium]